MKRRCNSKKIAVIKIILQRMERKLADSKRLLQRIGRLHPQVKLEKGW